MTEIVPRVYIPVREVVFPLEKGRQLGTLVDVRQHLKLREVLFHNRLQALSRSLVRPSNLRVLGWQEILDDGKGYVHKRARSNKNRNIDQSNIFTGAGLCAIAQFALIDGLEQVVDTNIKVDTRVIETDFNGESWNSQFEASMSDYHQIVRLTDLRSGEKIIIDGVYGGIHHAFSGRIVCMTEEEARSMYRPGYDGFNVSILGARDEYINDLKTDHAMKQEDYDRLVQTIL